MLARFFRWLADRKAVRELAARELKRDSWDWAKPTPSPDAVHGFVVAVRDDETVIGPVDGGCKVLVIPVPHLRTMGPTCRLTGATAWFRPVGWGRFDVFLEGSDWWEFSPRLPGKFRFEVPR